MLEEYRVAGARDFQELIKVSVLDFVDKMIFTFLNLPTLSHRIFFVIRKKLINFCKYFQLLKLFPTMRKLRFLKI